MKKFITLATAATFATALATGAYAGALVEPVEDPPVVVPAAVGSLGSAGGLALFVLVGVLVAGGGGSTSTTP